MVDSLYYFGKEPSHQNALDLFKGEWSTRLPDASGLVASTGPVRACEDYRVEWYAPYVGGFKDKRVLELGPLEAGHTYMLEKMGAADVLSIEANSRAYLKCLIMKEAFGLTKVRFMLGDFLPYLKDTSDQFEVAFCSGVLYHQTSPVELLRLLSKRCKNLFIWSHFYDADFFAKNPGLARQFTPKGVDAEVAGFRHQLFKRDYAGALDWKGFCGGASPEACWLRRDDMLGALKHFGFEIQGKLEEYNNPNGPAILIAATKA